MTGPYREEQPSPADVAIRSIRVASTLVAQFDSIAYRGESSIEDLELRIRQSQEIYPSIWQHLDDARRALAAHHRDVTEFDAIRSQELGHLGVTDVEASEKFTVSPSLRTGLRVRYSATKSATFNLLGIELATRAMRSLMRALPEVNWAALARAEDREIAAAGSLSKERWLAIAKVFAAALLVLAIAFVVRSLVMRAPVDTTRPARRPSDIAADTELVAARTRLAHLEDLSRRYQLTCDAAVRPELVKLLREADRPAAATSIETSPCMRDLPSCGPFYESINRRLTARYAASGQRLLDFSCKPIVTISATGDVSTAFAISSTGRGRDNSAIGLRGVISPDGARDVIAFELAPTSNLIGTADLDGDHADELVSVGGGRLVVTRIAADRFVDIEGPVLPEGCHADAAIETPSEDGPAMLVVSVDDPNPRADCPATGRHVYRLAGTALELFK